MAGNGLEIFWALARLSMTVSASGSTFADLVQAWLSIPRHPVWLLQGSKNEINQKKSLVTIAQMSAKTACKNGFKLCE